MTVSLLADGLLAVLLIATIGLGFRLNRRLNILRQDGVAFTQLVQSFETVAARAEASLAELRTASVKAEQVGRHLQDIDRLEEELGYLVSRAEGLADRLERGGENGRDAAPATERRAAVQDPMSPSGQSNGRDLRAALQGAR